MTIPSSLRLKPKIADQKPQQQLPSSLRPKEKLSEPETQQSDSSLKSHIQEIVSSKPTQAALGLLQGITSPLDLMKMFLVGEALTGLDEAEEASFRAGITFDKEKEKQKVLQSLENFPTQELAEKFIKEKTGINLEPQDLFSKIIRGISQFAQLTPKAKGFSKVLGPEEKELKEIGQKFGLRQFEGMEKSKAPSITPIVSESKEAKLASELSETSKKAIDDLISQKISVKKMRDSGVDLENAYETAFDSARNTASKMKNENINLSNVTDWIDQEIKKIRSSAPSMSKQDKIHLNILNEEKKSLLQRPSKGNTIDLITGRRNLPKTKSTNANQAINQYQKYNDNVKSIWKKPEFSGAENTVKNAYAGLNDQIIKSIEKANPELAKELKFANKIFHETSKLNQIEGILSKAFKDGYDPNKLLKITTNKRERQFLTRNIGKDGVQDLEKIGKYGKAAEEKIFDQLRNPTTIKEYLENMTPTQLALLAGFKAHAGLIYYIPKAIIHRVQGHLFTREPTRRAFVNFLKEGSQLGKSPAPLFIAAKKLQKSIEEEFGSEKDLLDLSRKDE